MKTATAQPADGDEERLAARDALWVIAVNIAWGLNFIAIKLAVDGLPPMLANALRFFFVLVVLWPFLRIRRGEIAALAPIAFLTGVVHFGLVFLAMALTRDLAPLAIAGQMGVPFSVLLAVVWLKERIGPWRILGLALSFLGVVVLSWDLRGFAEVLPLLLVLGSSFVYAVVTILMRRAPTLRPLTVQAWVAVMAVPGALLFSVVFEGDPRAHLEAAPWSAWLAGLYSALAASVFGHASMNRLLQRYPVTVISPWLLIAPVVAVAATAIVFHEAIGWREFLGGGLTLGGVYLINRRLKRRPSAVARMLPDEV